MLFSSRRLLAQALTISLLIHAALMLSVERQSQLRLDMPDVTTISMVIKPDKHGASAQPIPPQEAKPLPKTANQPKTIVREIATRSVSEAKDSSFAITEQPVQHSTDSVASNGVTSTSASTTTTAPASANDGVSANDMRQYKLSLAVAARRFRRYPALAKERGWEGTAEVELRVNSLLPDPEIDLIHSSGRDILDAQALEMMKQAMRVTSLPEGLKGRNFHILLPVKFSLEDSY